MFSNKVIDKIVQTPLEKYESLKGYLSRADTVRLADDTIKAMKLQLDLANQHIEQLEKYLKITEDALILSTDRASRLEQRVSELDKVIMNIKLIAEYSPKDQAILAELSKVIDTEVQ